MRPTGKPALEGTSGLWERRPSDYVADAIRSRVNVSMNHHLGAKMPIFRDRVVMKEIPNLGGYLVARIAVYASASVLQHNA